MRMTWSQWIGKISKPRVRTPTPPRSKRPKRMIPRWQWGKRTFQAWTKSEARAQVKSILGLDRLPAGTVIVRVPDRQAA